MGPRALQVTFSFKLSLLSPPKTVDSFLKSNYRKKFVFANDVHIMLKVNCKLKQVNFQLRQKKKMS